MAAAAAHWSLSDLQHSARAAGSRAMSKRARVHKSTRAERLCHECGRALEVDPLAYAHQLIETLVGVMQVRQAVPGETTEQHRARSAERYESQTIHARVVLSILLDEIDGFCVFCSPRSARLLANGEAELDRTMGAPKARK